MNDLLEFVDGLGISLPAEWVSNIEAYYELMMERNQICNLTRITDYKEYLFKHIADSLLVYKAFPELTDDMYRLLDLGCGAGVPGIPLALTFPNLLCTEVDARRKKVEAVHFFIEELELENAEAVHANGFELSNTEEYNEQIDIVIARAVGHTAKIVQQTRRFLVPGSGIIIACKTPQQLEDEKDELYDEIRKRQIKLKAKASEIYELPFDYGSRQFWILTQDGKPKR